MITWWKEKQVILTQLNPIGYTKFTLSSKISWLWHARHGLPNILSWFWQKVCSSLVPPFPRPPFPGTEVAPTRPALLRRAFQVHARRTCSIRNKTRAAVKCPCFFRRANCLQRWMTHPPRQACSSHHQIAVWISFLTSTWQFFKQFFFDKKMSHNLQNA